MPLLRRTPNSTFTCVAVRFVTLRQEDGPSSVQPHTLYIGKARWNVLLNLIANRNCTAQVHMILAQCNCASTHDTVGNDQLQVRMVRMPQKRIHCVTRPGVSTCNRGQPFSVLLILLCSSGQRLHDVGLYCMVAPRGRLGSSNLSPILGRDSRLEPVLVCSGLPKPC